ncbi:exodeoxyribonuclease III [Actinotignum urinale]|uniref:exodeoxyribonuclease III n=1 Tax=Actinotignum urinale TaxID=190146 RepID=UPI002542FF4A|nr:exodeoxyribonuclease III [Actinotignum urinale]WIK59464.1 exodeoxyribonuclease III [Actinotignum urinale]
MRIGSWNINSIRARTERAQDVLNRWNLDVLLLQETKCKPEQFPVAPFEEAGYEVACIGLNQWNGVAILSRVGLENVRTYFPGQPGFSKEQGVGVADTHDTADAPGASNTISATTPALFSEAPLEARAIGARVGGETGKSIDVWSLYVPNGRAYEDPHYFYKLRFLNNLRTYIDSEIAQEPERKILLAGDWNIAPQDEDVWDIDFFRNDVGFYASHEERTALAGISETGFTEVSRNAEGTYTFWDYQKLRFPKNQGMRIDFAYSSPALTPLFTQAWIDRDERKGKGASDHVPVVVEFDL